jgi:hypothetical protein
MPTSQGRDEFAETGRVWLRAALTEADLAPFDALAASHAGKPGARLAAHPTFAPDAPLGRILAKHWPKAVARRALIFDKTEAQNWGLPWHQDRVVAVGARHDMPGYQNWSQKQGVWHCEPPVEILNQMLFVRLHLDPSESDNGAMEVALGSHRAGIIPDTEARTSAQSFKVEPCLAERGDVLVLHMLTLHRSSPALRASARRTMRIDYALTDLPAPLAWAM